MTQANIRFVCPDKGFIICPWMPEVAGVQGWVACCCSTTASWRQATKAMTQMFTATRPMTPLVKDAVSRLQAVYDTYVEPLNKNNPDRKSLTESRGIPLECIDCQDGTLKTIVVATLVFLEGSKFGAVTF